MWLAYKQHIREFVKGGRAALVNHSLDEGLRLKDARNQPSGPELWIIPAGPNYSRTDEQFAVPPGRDMRE